MKTLRLPKFLAMLLVAVLVLPLAGSLSGHLAALGQMQVQAQTAPNTAGADEVNVVIDGNKVVFDGQGPAIVDGRTLVPVRGVFEALDFEVGWDGDTQTATLVNARYVVDITIGSITFVTNGISQPLDVPAQIIGGRTMLPIRAVLESVGYDLEWDGVTRTVLINNSNSGNTAQVASNPNPTSNPSAPSTLPPTTSTGLLLTERTFFTQEELREMIPTLDVRERLAHPDARGVTVGEGRAFREELNIVYPETAHQTPHPNRRMTDKELQAWIREYNELGGINIFELEVLYLLNNIRVEHGLTPYTLCPDLSMAARLQTQLITEFVFWGHNDPIYGGPYSRARLFGAVSLGENLVAGSTPSDSVGGWMESPPHRALILNANRYIVGIGRSGGQTILKVAG